MSSYVVGLTFIVIALAMIAYGKARNGVPRPFLQSYPAGMAYVSATMILLVVGIAWLFFGAG
jgi:hypothetical protein